MKRMILSLAAALLCTMLLAAAVTASAADRVIYIADNGNGDGSSADKPLKTEFYDPKKIGSNANYLNHPLYQAVDKLKETGGTVVVCGPLTISSEHMSGSDFTLPISGDNHITLTSVYGDADYRRTKGAGITLGGNLSFRGDVLLENLTISTTRMECKLCFGGYDAVVGEGVSCNKNESGADGYPMLVGGNRYHHLYGDDTNLTVLSGTWTSIVGGCFGANAETEQDYAYGAMIGDVHLTIGGKASVTRTLFCSTPSSAAPFMGDAYVTIQDDAAITGRIFGTGEMGVIGNHTIYLDVNGGKFNCEDILGSALGKNGRDLPTAILDASDYEGVLSAFNNADKFDAILYPNKMLKTVELVKEPSDLTVCKGFAPDLSGAVFKASYENRGSVIESEYPYEICKNNITASVGEDGNVSITFGSSETPVSYQGKLVNTPALSVEGAQIKTSGRNQGLRFVAKLEKSDALQITRYGLLIAPAVTLSSPDQLRFDNVYGMTVVDATGKPLKEENGFVYFTGAVANLPEEEYEFAYTAVAFYEYQSGEVTGIVYSDAITRSVYDVAKAMENGSRESVSALVAIRDDVVYKTENSITYVRPQAILDDMRQTVVDYMKKLGSIRWTNRVQMDFTSGPIEYAAPNYTSGMVLQGLLYNGGKSTLEEWEYDLTGNAYTNTKKTDFYKVTGTSCSHSIFAAYQLVAADVQISGATRCIPAMQQGVIGVGEYDYEGNFATTEAMIMGDDKTVRAAEQRIYAAYAEMTPGDILLQWWLNKNNVPLGHTILCASEPVLVYNSNGTINGNASYVLIHEQHATLLEERGYKTTWRLDYKMTFSTLLSRFFVPVSISPMKTGYSATPYCIVTDLPSGEELAANGLSGRIDSNYRIRWYTVSVKDASGKEVYTDKFFPLECQTANIDFIATKDDFASLPKGQYTCELSVAFAQKDEKVASIFFEKN
ncbi:MAG: hypothetical protein E7655_07200 [Ruminococcaceae bacterium]|nr:hypothetical protein [Oscillospiraceae bacterium]